MRFIDPGTQSAGVGGGVCLLAVAEQSNLLLVSCVSVLIAPNIREWPVSAAGGVGGPECAESAA